MIRGIDFKKWFLHGQVLYRYCGKDRWMRDAIDLPSVPRDVQDGEKGKRGRDGAAENVKCKGQWRCSELPSICRTIFFWFPCEGHRNLPCICDIPD